MDDTLDDLLPSDAASSLVIRQALDPAEPIIYISFPQKSDGRKQKWRKQTSIDCDGGQRGTQYFVHILGTVDEGMAGINAERATTPSGWSHKSAVSLSGDLNQRMNERRTIERTTRRERNLIDPGISPQNCQAHFLAEGRDYWKLWACARALFLRSHNQLAHALLTRTQAIDTHYNYGY